MKGTQEALDAVQDMKADDDSITHQRSDGGRHEFAFERVVHAHYLPDDWQFVGIGEGWFAIEERSVKNS